jgi:hypothetical protein
MRMWVFPKYWLQRIADNDLNWLVHEFQNCWVGNIESEFPRNTTNTNNSQITSTCDPRDTWSILSIFIVHLLSTCVMVCWWYSKNLDLHNIFLVCHWVCQAFRFWGSSLAPLLLHTSTPNPVLAQIIWTIGPAVALGRCRRRGRQDRRRRD